MTGSAGSFDARREGVTFAATEGAHRYTLDASHFATDGYRAHSFASCDQFNGKWTWEVSAATRLDTVVNILDQDALDPLGLTRALWQQNPRQAPAIAFTQAAAPPWLRLDNATNRRYAGSVIVNKANSRFFEPAPIRNWRVSLTARYRF